MGTLARLKMVRPVENITQPAEENNEIEPMKEETQENNNHKEQKDQQEILEEDTTDKEEHCDYDIDKKEEKEADHDTIELE
ncbi:hypothetical protein K7X08_004287 [Anisodus acutangulus]|uniref:Uncharacterized protein n=1 Tax=Anisodus acutangulus TaxID=402998 RepID=A0A9Q1MKU9_9SOLA|nr:hypothetical protein K7X08_004287 [Anisodus acutangulus]